MQPINYNLFSTLWSFENIPLLKSRQTGICSVSEHNLNSAYFLAKEL